ncbi:MAG: hypothetical protein A2622_00655 [Bdellovibrionales bacterium RIFCSPHIGHO2_01_FULL_40_29]|nr:MAG: hypothetical protein A2622_00655 [Bdellovibrionales bacterium RIFCSPHIGHO2_01_FULL_40_29]OFZ32629.1 MAG: hypothetical protein A3D17_05255 [Bdellovibrionales bacterium RIFCSPHIGHO2_02_FULL_40_15]
MKSFLSLPLLAIIVTSLLFSGCGERITDDNILNPEQHVDQLSLSKFEKNACAGDQKLVINPGVTNLNLNDFVVTGKVKAVAFRKGSADCVAQFIFNVNKFESKHSAQVNVQPDPLNPTRPDGVFSYEFVIANTQPNTCISNGSVWQVISTQDVENLVQIFFKNLSEPNPNSYMYLSSDKLIPTQAIAANMGLLAYTCQ